jgi:hypothetical protein
MQSENLLEEGDDVLIKCDIDSNPGYTNISWFLNSELLQMYSEQDTEMSQPSAIQNDFSYSFEIDKSILRIKNVRSSYDDSVLRCGVSNYIYYPLLSKSLIFTNEVATKLRVICKFLNSQTLN